MLFKLHVQIENPSKKFDKITKVLNQPKEDIQTQATIPKPNSQLNGHESKLLLADLKEKELETAVGGEG